MKINIKMENDEGTFCFEFVSKAAPEPEVLTLSGHGPQKIAVIKTIRAFTGMALKDAKEASERVSKFTCEDLRGVAEPSLKVFGDALVVEGANICYSSSENDTQEFTCLGDILDAFKKG